MAAVGSGFTYWAMMPAAKERIQSAVPPLPNLSEAVPALRDKLSEAHQAAVSVGSIDALAHYGRLLHANDYADEAAQVWGVMMREDTAEGRWPYYLGHLRRNTGDIGETTALFQATVERDPSYTPAWLLLGDMALKSGRFLPAQQYYQERLNRLPDDPYTRLGLARIDLQQGKREIALNALRQLVDDHPQFASAHNLLARLYRETGDEYLANEHRWEGYKAGRFITADDPWLRALDDVCYTPARLFVIGMVDFQTHEPARGRSAYERAVEIESNNPGNHELLGDLYRKLKEPALARGSLRRSIELSATQNTPPSLLAFINLVAVERELGELKASETTAKIGINAHPQSPELWVESGLTAEAQGDFKAAKSAYQHALTLSPNDTAANFHQGELLMRVDQIDAAMSYFERTLVQQPTFAPSLRYLIQYHLSKHQLETVSDYADTLLGAYWGEPEVRKLVAIYHFRAGREALADNQNNTAIAQFKRAFELNPDDADIAFELGSLLLAQGNFKTALAPLTVWHEKHPDNARAHLFLAQAHLMNGQRRKAQHLLEKGFDLAQAAGQYHTAQNIEEMLNTISR